MVVRSHLLECFNACRIAKATLCRRRSRDPHDVLSATDIAEKVKKTGTAAGTGDFMRFSRRDVLRMGAALSACAASQGSRAFAQTNEETLGAIAQESGITFGTSIAADTMEIPAQAALYLHQARIFTVDWALMFGNLRPEANLFLPGDAEAILAFADAGNLPVHGHALAWNESRPEWLMSLSKAGKQKALDRHIDETVG
ncbi:MAG TPA: endo-1,4-beta-xylanase, partial [Kaistia sp.]|nr:endo-1,4-beta-xylanase [Kaistia sp.]